jgi:hypothetical protein
MSDRVWVCHFGANLSCLEKADLSQEPSPEMQEYCQADPIADFIPAATTGRATVCEWRCTDGNPTVVQPIFNADPQGYIAEFWFELLLP